MDLVVPLSFLVNIGQGYYALRNHRRTGCGGGASLVNFYLKVGQFFRQFLLKSRAIFLFMFCFTNILNIFFSFVTCSMHKNPALKRLYFSKFSWRACPRTPLEVGQICVRPPPKFLSTYAYVRNSKIYRCPGPDLIPNQILKP